MQQYSFRRHILGSEADIIIVAEESTRLDSGQAKVWAAIQDFEQQFSRFIPTSELSLFNANAGAWVEISSGFRDMLNKCKHFAVITNGLFNPFVLPVLQSVGYGSSWPTASSNIDQRLDMRSRILYDMAALEIVGNKARIPVDSALDFGGIGKGVALDIAGTILSENGFGDYSITFGGDVLCHGFNLNGTPWRIGIVMARSNSSKETVGIIVNADGDYLAAASSSVMKRRGADWHHIIDPRTGTSSDSAVLMATAVCRSGVAADIFAKSIVIEPSTDFMLVPTSEKILATCLQLNDDSVLIHQDSAFITR